MDKSGRDLPSEIYYSSRSKSKEGSLIQERGSPKIHDAKTSPEVFYDATEDPPVIDLKSKVGPEVYTTRVAETRLPGSFGEGKNVEYMEKKEVNNKTDNNSDRSNSQSKSSSSDKLKGRGSALGSYRRHGAAALASGGGGGGKADQSADDYSKSKSEKSAARRISLDDLSTAFQGGVHHFFYGGRGGWSLDKTFKCKVKDLRVKNEITMSF